MSGRLRESVWSALRIAIKPTALAEVAGRLRPRSAFWSGVFGASMATTIVPAAVFGSGGEPYPGLREYVLYSTIHLPFVTLLFTVPFWSIALGTIFGGPLHSTHSRTRYLAKVFVLSPMTIVLPAVCWSVGAALVHFSLPEQGYYGPAGRPLWLDYRGIQLWGSPSWLIAFLFIMLILGIHAARRFGEFAEDEEFPACAFCRYNLTGNTSGVCPECGEAIVAQVSSSESRE